MIDSLIEPTWQVGAELDDDTVWFGLVYVSGTRETHLGSSREHTVVVKSLADHHGYATVGCGWC